MAEAALRANRAPEDVRLIAVSKTFPVEAVLEAMDAGQRDFGENRVEEALPKKMAVAQMRDSDVRWHLIGHVQSRKARDAAGQFDFIHSVDSFKLAHKLNAVCVARSAIQDILLECNVGGEVAKDGFAMLGWVQDRAVFDAFAREVAQIASLPGLRVRGLMTMAPIVDEPAQARPFFASLSSLREALRERFPQADWTHLSMGMTDDFEAAIAEGATLVRIGRAIFGAR
jgi:pyridoxal phosphate enzyme (YggS family)